MKPLYQISKLVGHSGILPETDTISCSKACDILDAALRLQKEVPGGSVLKYAAKSIIRKIDGLDAIDFTKYLLKLSFHYPILIPILLEPMSKAIIAADPLPISFESEILQLLLEAIRNRMSDSIAWLLYLQKRFYGQLPDHIATAVQALGDSIPLILLSQFTEHIDLSISAFNALDKDDLYLMDSHWMFGYELYRQEYIECPYQDDVFPILKDAGVSFLGEVNGGGE